MIQDDVTIYKLIFLWENGSVKIQEENKSNLKFDNACYHSVQDLVSSSIPFPKYKI